jgi:membrane protease YdiL (CAAX protease family)
MSRDDTPHERKPWRLRDAAAALGGGVLAAIIAFLVVDPASADATAVFGVLVPAQSLGMLATVAFLARRRQPWREALRWSVNRSDWLGLLIGAGLQVALALVAATLLEVVLRRELPTQEVVEAVGSAAGTLDWALVVLGVVVLAPIAEEIVFRGVVLRALERTRGRRIAVYGSASLFALIHLLDPNAVVAVPFLFVLGVILGNEVIRTGRLGRAVTIHAGFNLVTVLALMAVA